MVDKVDKIWMNGELIPWEDARVHVLTHTLHYGLGVFEGIRCYETHDGRSAIFRLPEHIRRLFDSARIADLPMPFSEEAIQQACLDTVRANRLSGCYVRPLAFIGDGAMGLGATENPTVVSIIAWRWGAYLGEEGLRRGIRAKVSSFTRPGVNMLMAKGKIVGHYVNSILAKRDAVRDGYDEAVLLDGQGYVAEATGENIFLVRDERVITPPLGMSILGGITRDTVLRVVATLGIPCVERAIGRDELYIADEVFMCGTAAEVTPVREVDGRTIGKGERGPLTEGIQAKYFDAVRGVNVPDETWLSYV